MQRKISVQIQDEPAGNTAEFLQVDLCMPFNLAGIRTLRGDGGHMHQLKGLSIKLVPSWNQNSEHHCVQNQNTADIRKRMLYPGLHFFYKRIHQAANCLEQTQSGLLLCLQSAGISRKQWHFQPHGPHAPFVTSHTH